MAGNYPDVPAPRMAYDRDGTVAVRLTSDGDYVSQFTGTQMENGNDERNGTFGNDIGCIAFLFPELRDVLGYLIQHNAGFEHAIETSVDTTNGADGTWTNRGGYTVTGWGPPAMRDNIQPLAITGVKAIRFRANTNAGDNWRIALFGHRSAGESPDRLVLWHPTLDETLDSAAHAAHFDWGDILRGTSDTVDFRVKNLSPTLTANSITLATEALDDTASPSFPGSHQFDAGAGFAGSVNIGNLDPEEVSDVVTVRLTAAAAASPWLWWARIVASAASFS